MTQIPKTLYVMSQIWAFGPLFVVGLHTRAARLGIHVPIYRVYIYIDGDINVLKRYLPRYLGSRYF